MSDAPEVKITTRCQYYGGIEPLGTHGHHLWIHDGRIGHGEFHLAHAIPLTDVAGVELGDRESVGSEVVNVRGLRGAPAERSGIVTDVKVHTKDGSTGLWFVEGRDVSWVREKLAPALEDAGVPFVDEAP